MKSAFFEGVSRFFNAVGLKNTSSFLSEDLERRNSLFEGMEYEVKATGGVFQALLADIKNIGSLFKGSEAQTANAKSGEPPRDMQP